MRFTFLLPLLAGCFDLTVQNDGTVPVRCTARYADSTGAVLTTTFEPIAPGDTGNAALDNTDFISAGTVIITCQSLAGTSRCQIPDDPTTRDFLAMTVDDGETTGCFTGVAPPM